MSGDEILSILLGSEARGELLTLFHRNPGLIDTVDGVARRIGRTAMVIERDIQELVRLGVLKQKKIGTSEVILLDRARDRQVLEAVANRLKSAGSGEGN